MPIHKIVEDMRVRYQQGDRAAVNALARVIGPYLRRIVRRALRASGTSSEFAQRIQRLAGTVQGRIADASAHPDLRISQICERLCESMLCSDASAREMLPAHETWFGTANMTVA